MSWICPNCNFVMGDDSYCCSACNYRVDSRLVLTSATGNAWRTILGTEVTRRTYKRLYPNEEHQYIPRNEDEHPFSVEKKDDNAWVLKPNGNSPVGVALNGNVCDDDAEYALNDGDSITIASRNDSSKQIAPLKVSFAMIDDAQ